MKSNGNRFLHISLALFAGGILASSAAGAQSPAPPGTAQASLGAFRPSPALSLYVINAADSASGRLAIRRGPRNEGDRLMVRVFDADEKLTFRQYLEPGQLKDTFGPGSGEIWGIPIAIPDTIVAANDLLADMTLSLRGTGIHQIRVTAGQMNSAVQVTLERPCDYGVSFQNGTYYPWDKAVTAAYVYVPAPATEIVLRGQGVTVEDETGRVVFPPAGNDGRKDVTVPVSRTGVVWTFRFADPAKWSFAAGGFPVILCNSAKAAETIRASLETLPDGTVVAHKFQRRIAELLPTLLAPDKVGSTEELLKIDLFQNRDAWLAEPARNEHLLSLYGLFPALYKALREQNVDPASPWSGAVGFAAWRANLAKPAPENRWDHLRLPPGCWGGLSIDGDWAKVLAEAATLDAPLNPFFSRQELLYRAVACSLRDLLALPEHEVPRMSPGVGGELDAYPGFFGFLVARKYFPEYAIAAQRMPPEIRTVWTEALQHLVDRHLPDMMVSAMNQSSHYLVGWYLFAEGSGDPRYADLARRYAERFARSAAPAGYFIENCGPDATYCGMQHFHMGLYARLSNDPVMLAALRRSYTFFNHTVGPEPGGVALGGFNFSHRTPDGFHNEQYAGARGQLGDVLPEVALWSRAGNTPEKQAEAREKLMAQFGKPLPEPRFPSMAQESFHWWPKSLAPAVWPAAEAKPFVRDFAGELICVKRPAYYAAIYTGKPVQDKYYLLLQEVFRRPLPERAEDAGGDAWKLYYTIHPASPLLGGGLTLFWTPAYGNALLAGNCSPLVHHGLVATDKDGRRSWEDYFQRSHALDAKAGTLRCSGKVEGLPLQYSRDYEFAPAELRVTLTLTADDDLQLSDLIENIPVPGGAAKKRGAEIVVRGEQPEPVPPTEPNADKIRLGRGSAASFTIADTTGAGVEVRLDQARELRTCRSGMKSRDLQLNRVEIVLPTTFKKGEPVVLSYTLAPIRATD